MYTDAQDLVVPEIHDNGTGKDRLTANLDAVMSHLQGAYDALKRGAPNPRDYSAGRYEKAVQQQQRRLKTIDELIDELATEACAIAERG